MICSNDIRQLDLVSRRAAEFYRTHDMSQLPCGRYELGGGDYLNIENYFTRDRDGARYEAHCEHVDIQMVLEGEEVIEVCHLGGLTEVEPYEIERDVVFYDGGVRGELHLLRPGSFIHLLPEDAHMPQLSGGERTSVKKAVFKLKTYRSIGRIRFLVMDVDGTMTDGRVFIGASGELFKCFDVKDGLGITEILPKLGIIPVIITGRKSEMLARRCAELGIDEVHQGVCDKLSTLKRIVDVAGESLSSVCYVGDDLNDLECMSAVSLAGGYAACPKDAVEKVRASADRVLSSPGGRGAIREIINLLENRSASQ